ncbi:MULTISPECIES: transcriptional regulator [unclassified Actinotalea]|uniref:helix-turn-helix transcriptional regulator n=1 Tax=unclassified Actinotalea TaxID=2638618 RepID=UPI0015F540A6|nr:MULTISPECIES: PAS domain-containing protein [unclassified Actinotalea]
MTSREQPAAGPSALEADQALAVLGALVEPLAAALPGDAEVVLHDLRRLPNSIIAIAGDVTGRGVGSPATDLLLRRAADGTLATNVGYETRLPDGRVLLSTTIVVRDSAGTPVAALCINSDVMIWQAVKAIAEAMLPGTTASAGTAEPAEKFVHDIDELAQHLLTETIDACGVPVELMQKKHKLAVVGDLKSRGFFLLKESVEIAAQALQVTRFTIYNYLNELGSDDADGESPARGRS